MVNRTLFGLREIIQFCTKAPNTEVARVTLPIKYDEVMGSQDSAAWIVRSEPEALIHHEHIDLGLNYRMSNLLAALGCAQLADMPRRSHGAGELSLRYCAALGDLFGVAFMPVADYGEPNWWLTYLTIDAPRHGPTATRCSSI